MQDLTDDAILKMSGPPCTTWSQDTTAPMGGGIANSRMHEAAREDEGSCSAIIRKGQPADNSRPIKTGGADSHVGAIDFNRWICNADP